MVYMEVTTGYRELVNGLYGRTTGYRELSMVYMDVPLATGNCQWFIWTYHWLQGTVNGLYGRTTGYRELLMVYMDVPLATGNW